MNKGNTEAGPDKKKRGGQFRNQNARTHGIYSRIITPEQEKMRAEAAGLNNLDEEIALVRLKILSILANDPGNHPVLMRSVAMLVKMLKINNLVKTEVSDQCLPVIDTVLLDSITGGKSKDSAGNCAGRNPITI